MPVVKQLSIFLANKPGVLARLCETFADHKINIQGLSISDTVDHAVVRMITSNPEKARAVLEDAAVLVVETRDRHPILGHGLCARLHLPIRSDGNDLSAWPLRLNELERDTKTSVDLLGSWCLGPNPEREGLLFTAFYPNTLWQPGRLARIVASMALRARWLEPSFLPGAGALDRK